MLAKRGQRDFGSSSEARKSSSAAARVSLAFQGARNPGDIAANSDRPGTPDKCGNRCRPSAEFKVALRRRVRNGGGKAALQACLYRPGSAGAEKCPRQVIPYHRTPPERQSPEPYGKISSAPDGIIGKKRSQSLQYCTSTLYWSSSELSRKV